MLHELIFKVTVKVKRMESQFLGLNTIILSALFCFRCFNSTSVDPVFIQREEKKKVTPKKSLRKFPSYDNYLLESVTTTVKKKKLDQKPSVFICCKTAENNRG